MSINSEFVTHRQWDGCARRIERKNLELHGSSLTSSGIARKANDFIIEIQDDQKGMMVKKGWRDAMKAELQK